LLSNTTLREALREYYAKTGLPPDGGAEDEWFSVHIGPLALRFPNPPARRRAVFFHDANHLLTGYDTVFSKGEILIAGYELGSGCGSYWFAWLINFLMFGVGLLVRPRELYRAFLRGRHCRSLYERIESPRVMSELPLAALRAQVGITDTLRPNGVADSLLFSVWMLAAVAVPAGALFASLHWLASK